MMPVLATEATKKDYSSQPKVDPKVIQKGSLLKNTKRNDNYLQHLSHVDRLQKDDLF